MLRTDSQAWRRWWKKETAEDLPYRLCCSLEKTNVSKCRAELQESVHPVLPCESPYILKVSTSRFGKTSFKI